MNDETRTLTVWLDVISPYSWLLVQRLPTLAGRPDLRLSLRPVLFAGLLKHWGQLGPAEIAPKRDWTYRQVAWLAHSQGLSMAFPATHPFNPLAPLRLLLAQGDARGTPGEVDLESCLQVFAHVWTAGAVPDAPARLAELAARLAPGAGEALLQCCAEETVKQQLRVNVEEAIARGVFGVPTLQIDDRSFFGFDALPMVEAYLAGDAWLCGEAWDAAAAVGAGVVRRQS